MKRVIIGVLILVSMALQGATTEPYTKALVTLTNLANIVNGVTVDVNGDVRRATNGAVANVSTWWHITNSLANQATNLMRHFSQYAPAGPVDVWTNGCNATNFYLVGAPGQTLTVTLSANFGSVTYETNQWTNTYPVHMPFTIELQTTRTSIMSDFVASLNIYPSNSLATGTMAVANLADLKSAQTLSNKTLAGSAMRDSTTFTNVDAQRINFKHHADRSAAKTNGGQMVFYDHSTNSYSAIRAGTNGAPGLYDASGGLIWNDDALSVAIVPNSAALINAASAISYFPLLAPQPSAGKGSNNWTGPNYWSDSTNTFAAGLRLPAGFTATYGTWTAGTGEVARLTVTNLSSAAPAVVNLTNINGAADNLTVTTLVARAGTTLGLMQHNSQFSNAVFVAGGSNVVEGSWGVRRLTVTSIAAGNNVAQLFTNAYVRLTGGPGGDWTLCGIMAGWEDQVLRVINDTGFTMAIPHESGVDPTAGNRIATPGSTTIYVPNGGTVKFSYTGSRWKVLNHYPEATVSRKDATFTNGSYTNLLSDRYVYLPAGAARTNRLFDVTQSTNALITVKDAVGHAAGTNIIVTGLNGQTIDGATSYTINNAYGSVTFQGYGTNWAVVSRY